MEDEEKALFYECVKEEIRYHKEFIEVYKKDNLMLFKHLIDLHHEAIEQLEILI